MNDFQKAIRELRYHANSIIVGKVNLKRIADGAFPKSQTNARLEDCWRSIDNARSAIKQAADSAKSHAPDRLKDDALHFINTMLRLVQDGDTPAGGEFENYQQLDAELVRLDDISEGADKLISREDAAELIDASVDHVRRLAREGKLKAVGSMISEQSARDYQSQPNKKRLTTAAQRKATRNILEFRRENGL